MTLLYRAICMIISSPRSREWKSLIAFSAGRSCRFAGRYLIFDAVKERIIKRQPMIILRSFGAGLNEGLLPHTDVPRTAIAGEAEVTGIRGRRM